MERIYFEINEKLAFDARRQWSFTDYVVGTITEEYKESVNEVYDLVDKVKENRPDYAEEAYQISLKYARKLAEWWNAKHNIDMMCPSVMISGGANFPVKKKEKQISKMDAHYKEMDYIKSLPNKIEKILKGDVVIKSNDENAIEKLEQKVEELEQLKKGMIEGNKYYKKNGTLEGFTGLSEDNIKRTMYLIEQGIFGSSTRIFDTTNTNASIKSTKTRIEKLKQEKEKGTRETEVTTENENSSYIVVENTELMRLQLLFNDKPSEEVRTLLKSKGFKWSPKNNAWQRQLTDNARYAFKMIKSDLDKIA